MTTYAPLLTAIATTVVTGVLVWLPTAGPGRDHQDRCRPGYDLLKYASPQVFNTRPVR